MNGRVRKSRSIEILAAVVLAFVALAPGGTASAGVGPGPGTNPGFIPREAKYAGHSYGEWSNMWWQWAFSLPVVHGNEEANPLFDTTGINCGVGQSGQVWFLAGVYAPGSGEGPTAEVTPIPPIVRDKCVVPAGTALFFPVINYEDDVAYYYPNTPPTEEEIRAGIAAIIPQMHDFGAVIDGRQVANVEQYRIGAGNPAVSVTLPEDNLNRYYQGSGASPAGTYYPMVNDGYYLMLAPLSVGHHTVEFYGWVSDWFALHVIYQLTVAPQ